MAIMDVNMDVNEGVVPGSANPWCETSWLLEVRCGL